MLPAVFKTVADEKLPVRGQQDDKQPHIPLAEQRRLFRARWDSLIGELAAA